MAKHTTIEWADHTFNPWVGCTKVSAACDQCYAEAWDQRFNGGLHWGPHADRRRTKTWGDPVRWNREAEAKGVRELVFCASLADVFDNHRSIRESWRSDLWRLIQRTPHLVWLLLTKRPQNITKMLPEAFGSPAWGVGWDNVWLGTTVENQTEFDRRVPHLTAVPARVHFLSMEPLQGPVNMGGLDGVEWVITGGESGPAFRHADPDWFRSLRDQAIGAGVPFLFKQWDGLDQRAVKARGRKLDGVEHNGYPPGALPRG
jgi:protein gp37